LALAALPASASAVTATKHHLDMYKAEKHLTLTEMDTQTVNLSCRPGDIAADGMWRVDSVGQFNPQLVDPDELTDWGPGGWNLGTGVRVSQSQSIAIDTYQFTVSNRTSEDAQVKFWVTCIGSQTAADTHRHKLDVYTPAGHTFTNGTGDNEFYTSQWPGDGSAYGCNAGDLFIAPSWKVNHGDAESFASYPGTFGSPGTDLSNWTFGFYVKGSVDVTVGGRCLKKSTLVVNGYPKTHLHKLYWNLKTTEDPSAPFYKGNSVWEHQISCAEDQKGLVGGYDVRNGGSWSSHSQYWLGMDPRIKARAFKVYGGNGGNYYVVCVNDRTSRPFFS
jgi:hypothetical protein